ncbi:MAG: rhodanese-like domain-containing protein [Pseudomonadota bacterium]
MIPSRGVRYRWVIGLWLLLLAGLAASEVPVVDAPTAHGWTQAGKVTLIDVRTPEEWQESGVPAGAITIALQDPDLLRKVMLQADRDPNHPILLICRTGRRSGIAADLLMRAGFLNVANVREGVAGRSGVGPGWVRRGLPMEAYDPAQHSPAAASADASTP